MAYITTVGMTTPKGRLEKGDKFPGRPPKWLIDRGYVEKVEAEPENEEEAEQDG